MKIFFTLAVVLVAICGCATKENFENKPIEISIYQSGEKIGRVKSKDGINGKVYRLLDPPFVYRNDAFNIREKKWLVVGEIESNEILVKLFPPIISYTDSQLNIDRYRNVARVENDGAVYLSSNEEQRQVNSSVYVGRINQNGDIIKVNSDEPVGSSDIGTTNKNARKLIGGAALILGLFDNQKYRTAEITTEDTTKCPRGSLRLDLGMACPPQWRCISVNESPYCGIPNL